MRWAMLLFLGAGVVPTHAAGSALDTVTVDQVVAEWLSSTGAPSASIAIVQDGRLTYAKAYGAARLDPPTASTVASRYPIDSLSKEFTAAAILILAEQGKLSLDDPLAKWVPGLKAPAAITLRQLLTHTGGIRDFWPQDFVTPEMTQPTTAAAIIDEWVRRPLDFEPGTDWQYSNTGYVAAAAVVEKAAGVPLFEFLRRQVFEPLHMAHVIDYSSTPLGKGDAQGYTRYGLGPAVPAPKEGRGWLFGAAGLAMQPSDLALWDMSLINRSLLNAASYKAEFEPTVLKDGRVHDYGLGLDVESQRGRLRIGHSGGGSGFLADNRVWPQDRSAIVVLTNNDWADPGDLSERIAYLVLTPAPEDKRAREVFQALQNGSLDRGLFSEVGNFYLTAPVLADLRSSLGPLGPARLIELESESQRGGMTTRQWKILCRGARLEAVERSHPDGKIDEFLITKKQD
jgi:CubicO group peptidase (beta-lactamase class C family)